MYIIMSISNKQVKTFIHEIQKEYDCETFEEKDKNDKLVCQLCKGSYIRQKKSVHFRTNKHLKKVNLLKEKIAEIFN
jgi:hypothetical protein